MLKYTSKRNISDDNIKRAVQKDLDYVFKSPELLRQAFAHSTYANERGIASNEILEFFGDVALKLAHTDIIIDLFCHTDGNGFLVTEHDEGYFTQLRAVHEQQVTLARLITYLGWFEYLLIGNCGLAEGDSVKADLFESVIGAIYIDSGKSMDAVRSVVNRMTDLLLTKDKEQEQLDQQRTKNRDEASITHGESVDIFLKDKKFWNSNDMTDETGLLQIYKVENGFKYCVTFHSRNAADCWTLFSTVAEAKAAMFQWLIDLVKEWEMDFGEVEDYGNEDSD